MKLHPAYVKQHGNHGDIYEPEKRHYENEDCLNISDGTVGSLLEDIDYLLSEGYITKENSVFTDYNASYIYLDKPYFDEKGYNDAMQRYINEKSKYEEWCNSDEGQKTMLQHEQSVILTKIARHRSSNYSNDVINDLLLEAAKITKKLKELG